jgi:hypothetical protein
MSLVCARCYCTAIEMATGLLIGAIIMSYLLSKQVMLLEIFEGDCLDEYRLMQVPRTRISIRSDL